LDLNAPDFDKLWKERKARNIQMIQSVATNNSVEKVLIGYLEQMIFSTCIWKISCTFFNKNQ